MIALLCNQQNCIDRSPIVYAKRGPQPTRKRENDASLEARRASCCKCMQFNPHPIRELCEHRLLQVTDSIKSKSTSTASYPALEDDRRSTDTKQRYLQEFVRLGLLSESGTNGECV